jgi:hypothetical protein
MVAAWAWDQAAPGALTLFDGWCIRLLGVIEPWELGSEKATPQLDVGTIKAGYQDRWIT